MTIPFSHAGRKLDQYVSRCSNNPVYPPLGFLITGIFVLAAGCSSSTPASFGVVIPTPSVVDVSIQPDITHYDLAMSSAPGIGLSPQINVQVPAGGKYEYVWKTDYGSFLSWNAPDYLVKDLGADVRLTGGKVYWTYGNAAAGKERPVVHITLDIRDSATGATIGHAKRVIGWSEGDGAEVR